MLVQVKMLASWNKLYQNHYRWFDGSVGRVLSQRHVTCSLFDSFVDGFKLLRPVRIGPVATVQFGNKEGNTQQLRKPTLGFIARTKVLNFVISNLASAHRTNSGRGRLRWLGMPMVFEVPHAVT